MCKEMPVIPVNKVVGPKRKFGKNWKAEEEEERHKGSLIQKRFITWPQSSRISLRRFCS
jgi:hypothetical protein